MSGTLLDLAATYDREASSASRWQTRDERRRNASLFRRMICNRQAADPAQITITMTMLIDIPDRWCRQHGYRAVAGMGGYVIQRDDEAAILATVGDTLLWDGERIGVQRATP
ncbi:hypothetical protein [Streptomyces sp. B1I3]|uniref:hypothetical protein n=1 Tax=Streptomyces sp. B1I3 TaxID=3042264 RepID=UPI0027814065|nr:hypothetical protein [Streptomyces sp. B1I3]MDQ0791991.1 hypothetical protein [Streptomyces sp. B1I3]